MHTLFRHKNKQANNNALTTIKKVIEQEKEDITMNKC